jgi:hypothetical protein
VLILVILLLTVILTFAFVKREYLSKLRLTTEVFLGVEIAYGGVDDLKDLVDKVKNYSNLFIIGTLEISLNQTALNEACDYIYEAGLHFIVLFTFEDKYNYDPSSWIHKAEQKYGNKFLGVYRYDEPGGKQLDRTPSNFVVEAKDYADAAKTFVDYLFAHIKFYLNSSQRVFTADYGLYWFDYKGGYNAVFAEFGWNHSRELQVALCRGAAKVQNKDWGVIISWTYNHAPYIESASELYNDLVLAYTAGAKYIIVFNYPKIGRYGVLTDEHLSVLKKFWYFALHNQWKSKGNDAKVAYVLPSDYGFGFRTANDTMWGLWEADGFSSKIWSDVCKLIDRYGSSLDIVYDDLEFRNAIRSRYNKLIFWSEEVP